MSLEADPVQLCQFCNEAKFKYVCPKCNAPFCSLTCYKSTGHINCSEKFYKDCVQDELKTVKQKSRARMIYEMLERINEANPAFEPKDFDADRLDEPMDSDDVDPPDMDEHVGDNNDEYEADLANRLQDVDLDNSDEVWSRLTGEEQKEFQNLIENGDIFKLVPIHKPWWQKFQTYKIIDVTVEEKDIPTIHTKIPNFSTICNKEPSPCVHYNLWNILSAYACVIRYNNILDPNQQHAKEFVAELINLSSTLKYGTNFEDAEDAVISVEMEALTTKSGHGGIIDSIDFKNFAKYRETLMQDARQLMSQQRFKLAALSEIFRWFSVATKEYANKNEGEVADFYTLYAIGHGCDRLTSTKMKQILKKVLFLLSYVSR